VKNASQKGHAIHVMELFAIAADRLQNANAATRIGVVTAIHHVLGVEMVGVVTVSTVLRWRRKGRIVYTLE